MPISRWRAISSRSIRSSFRLSWTLLMSTPTIRPTPEFRLAYRRDVADRRMEPQRAGARPPSSISWRDGESRSGLRARVVGLRLEPWHDGWQGHQVGGVVGDENPSGTTALSGA